MCVVRSVELFVKHKRVYDDMEAGEAAVHWSNQAVKYARIAEATANQAGNVAQTIQELSMKATMAAEQAAQASHMSQQAAAAGASQAAGVAMPAPLTIPSGPSPLGGPMLNVSGAALPDPRILCSIQFQSTAHTSSHSREPAALAAARHSTSTPASFKTPRWRSRSSSKDDFL